MKKSLNDLYHSIVMPVELCKRLSSFKHCMELVLICQAGNHKEYLEKSLLKGLKVTFSNVSLPHKRSQAKKIINNYTFVIKKKNLTLFKIAE